ncbi:unnamed protein product [Vitrella brassicaformis CCMP3155]|uniref:RRM domain-containing protein n=1 Tax=Vitrella brassicaformis (strain CCMP3155) TaxID=1169540 RepID=A0A0G4FI69_VITBC|nr:unnamed protein product [Vitrella brassicaformis CCMP3155]|mmetsp:Transcript_37101/g.93106  ORF Transcript_37101/g.93106 Transcript_37101/m.93106 type:complete len:573 (-) Transcript_37101:68-1786(-)|eukprot:CEM13195.1 unnamed protein product [Vitrella brassicaformis CCMP3155]
MKLKLIRLERELREQELKQQKGLGHKLLRWGGMRAQSAVSATSTRTRMTKDPEQVVFVIADREDGPVHTSGHVYAMQPDTKEIHKLEIGSVKSGQPGASFREPKMTDIAMGPDGGLVLGVNGDVYRFDAALSSILVKVPELRLKMIKIACGDNHCAALSQFGALFHWGAYKYLASQGKSGFRRSCVVVQGLPPDMSEQKLLEFLSKKLTKGGFFSTLRSCQIEAPGSAELWFQDDSVLNDVAVILDGTIYKTHQGVPFPFDDEEENRLRSWVKSVTVPYQDTPFMGLASVAGKPIVDLVAGRNHIVMRTEIGLVCVLGSGELGQLGRPPYTRLHDWNLFPEVFDLNESSIRFIKNEEDVPGKIVKVHASHDNTILSVQHGDQIDNYVCGPNDEGQAGVGYKSDILTRFTKMVPLAGVDIVDVTGDSSSKVARGADGYLYYWGKGIGPYGALVTELTPKRLKLLGGGGDQFCSIGAGAGLKMATNAQGDLFAWGTIDYGIYRVDKPKELSIVKADATKTDLPVGTGGTGSLSASAAETPRPSSRPNITGVFRRLRSMTRASTSSSSATIEQLP